MNGRLFDAGELVLRPSVPARLRALASKKPRTATPSERLADEDRVTMERLSAQGAELAARFGLRIRSLEPERGGVVEHYGVCYEDGTIRIRLRHARTGRLLKDSSLVDTLCHELAHLRYLDHSLRFRRLYQRILATARRLGYYRPGPRRDPMPRQLRLFDPEACGTRRRART